MEQSRVTTKTIESGTVADAYLALLADRGRLAVRARLSSSEDPEGHELS